MSVEVTLPDLVDVATVVALPKVCILLEVFASENDDEIEEESANKTINTDSNDDNEHEFDEEPGNIPDTAPLVKT